MQRHLRKLLWKVTKKVKRAFGIVINKYTFGWDGPAPHYLSYKQAKGHAN
jgi:hypothetical protein